MERTNFIVEIDGSLGEGGGQMFRNSLALSTIFNKTVKFEKIRASRPNPGLNNQLITGLEIMQQVSSAKLEGATIKSQDLTYDPQGIKGGSFFGDCKTAGSVALMTQMITPAFLFAPEPSTVCLRGGTFVSFSPPIAYTQQILFPLLKRFGIKAEVQITKNGYSPFGGGEIELSFENVKEKLKPIDITKPGKIKRVYIECVTKTSEDEEVLACMNNLKNEMKTVMKTKYTDEEIQAVEFELIFNCPDSLKKDMTSTSKKHSNDKDNHKSKSRDSKEKKIVYGVLAFVSGDDIFFDCSVSEDKSDKKFFDTVLKTFKNYFKTAACVDDHTQDQLLLFMLLAEGVSKIRCTKEITDHTKSCFYIFQKFYSDFKYVLHEGDEYTDIEIQGIGFLRNE